MEILDLNHLNIISPYALWKTGSNGNEYAFHTDYGVQYRICFDVNQSIWENGAYEFGIYNDNGKTSPNDIKVKQTIISVIEEFFINNPDILLYQCETGDNKQNACQRLFYKWFNDSPNRDKYVLKVSSIIAEDIVNFIALIVNRNNPNIDRIIDDFDEFIGFFNHKPE